MATSLVRRVGSLILACLVIATPLTGCTAIHRIPMDPGIPETETKIAWGSGQRITGYTMADGTHYRFDGRVYLAGSDSLHFQAGKGKLDYPSWVDPSNVAGAAALKRFTLARTDVASVDARQGSPGKTTVLVLAIMVGSVGIFAALIAASGGIDLGM